MNRRSLILLALASPPFAAQAAPADEALTSLRSTIEEVLRIADRSASNTALATSARSFLQKRVSFETMTKRAVGLGWKQFNGAQQTKATDLFTTLVIRTYSKKFTPGEHPEIQYKAATSVGSGRVDVPTTLVYQGSRYSVVYRMEQAGGWRITDVVIEGVSLVANYRSQLDSTFKQGGADAVIRSLEQSVSRPS